MHTWLPTVLAIVAAFLIALGTVIRQRESADSGAINAKWWIGAVIAVGGFAAQATALGLGAILLVQPLIVLAVLFALPMEAWADDRHPHLNEWVWGLILVASVVTFLLIAQPEQSSRRPDFATLAFATSAVIAGVAILVVLAEKASDNHYRALYYGLAAGVMFGVSALLVKAVIMQAMDDWAIVFTHPQLYVLLIIAPGAIVVGAVTLGPGSSVWYNAVLRGDSNSISVGRDSNFRDGVAVHTEAAHGAVIGDRVSVGHNAVVHAAATSGSSATTRARLRNACWTRLSRVSLTSVKNGTRRTR